MTTTTKLGTEDEPATGTVPQPAPRLRKSCGCQLNGRRWMCGPHWQALSEPERDAIRGGAA